MTEEAYKTRSNHKGFLAQNNAENNAITFTQDHISCSNDLWENDNEFLSRLVNTLKRFSAKMALHLASKFNFFKKICAFFTRDVGTSPQCPPVPTSMFFTKYVGLFVLLWRNFSELYE